MSPKEVNPMRSDKFLSIAEAIGADFDNGLKIGGNYTSIVQTGNTLYISGQIPRIGDAVVVMGRAGQTVSLAEAQKAAKICVMRALGLLKKHLGSLDAVTQILRMTVYVQSSDTFTQQSEVADAASDVLHEIFGQSVSSAGSHTRTSIGVYQLPKNAAVELDLIVAIE